MLRQYLEVKAEHPDALLFYRMGDFFELFYEDAEIAAPVLDVALTARNKGRDTEAPMCGVPHHAVEAYVGKLLRAGYRVAICDQVEDPAEAKGLVRREVTRVVSPGTVNSPDLLEGDEENLLCCLVWSGSGGGGAFLEVTTGRFFGRVWETAEAAVESLRALRPPEILCRLDGLPEPLATWVADEAFCWLDPGEAHWLGRRDSSDLLERQLRVSTLRGMGLPASSPVLQAAATAVSYAREAQRNDLSHVRDLSFDGPGEAAVLDATSLANLEVFENQSDRASSATLLGVIGRTGSPAGGRLMRRWLGQPLRDADRIRRRHEAVVELVDDTPRRDRLRELLAAGGDLERLLSRAVLGTLSPVEAGALRDALGRVPEIQARLVDARAEALNEIAALDPCAELADDLSSTLAAELPATLKRGGVIAVGVSEELDRCRTLAEDSRQVLLALQERERTATGIGSLKVRYNKVFGYYLEVTKANQHLVPEHYVRKQTLVGAERYITEELKDLEERILEAEGRQLALEEELFNALQGRIAVAGVPLQALAAGLASLDVLAAFGEVAVRRGYVRPEILGPGEPIEIRDGRHPVVEALLAEPFVPNDTELDAENSAIVILTGPNMGGKSTYLRQTALIVLMAQAGSLVPAATARLGVVDRIFTRVGASDDLARGESTFMVEMIETARILRFATPQSLVILDEVGRGTATFDGLSLAWGIVEHLHRESGAKTLFATHYHELTELASILPRVVNRTVAVKEWRDEIVFLRRIVAGSADKSYGIHVARLAGLPQSVLDRASEILSNLEAQEYDLSGVPRLARGEGQPETDQSQMQLFAPAEEVVASVLRQVDLERLSPLAALNLLHSLKSRLG